MRTVYLYKKALALGKPNREQEEHWEDWDDRKDDQMGEQQGAESTGGKKKRVTTQPSDIELYERRTSYYFWPFGQVLPSPDLPPRDTPEEQVADMSVFDFFRFVKFHGGLRMCVCVVCVVCVWKGYRLSWAVCLMISF